ncbi:hypothetical protein [Woodsholea maritima]|uniref:hypothetical protein n=1 Tax=Woodsholea maritima TaxID=240237 RepID=UPI00037447F7|nr:hypothetical protein [Woodsholea maritima]
MASEDVHYEVFFKKNKKASWVLAEALHDRHRAVDMAKKLLKKMPQGSVRVTREKFDDKGRVFNKITIFTEGIEDFKEKKEAPKEAEIPCQSPDDLLGPSARETLRRVLAPWLERHEIAPMELFFRSDLAQKLDSSDFDLQQAVQKVAVARAQAGDGSVHDYVRILTDLAEKSIKQVSAEADARKGKLIKADTFRDLSEQVFAKGASEKMMRAEICHRLSKAHTMGKKAEMLLDFLDDLPSDAEAAKFAAKQTDAFLADVLSFDRALNHVVGETPDLGEEVLRLTTIYEGQANHDLLVRAPDFAKRLATRFKAKTLPESHAEIARRILKQLRAPRRFKPSNVLAEIQLARDLAQRLIAVSGPDLDPMSLVEAFTHRSARILAPDFIQDLISRSDNPCEQIQLLLKVEDNIVGEENKQKLATYVRATLKSQQTQSWFLRGPGQPLERLSQLTALQIRTERSTFESKDVQEICVLCDQTGLNIIEESEIYKRITGSGRPALDQAAALLKLAAGGVLPKPGCIHDAHMRAMRILSSPEGRKEAAEASKRDAGKLTEIQGLLLGVGTDTPPIGSKSASGM